MCCSPLPRYKCHKEVSAIKIIFVSLLSDEAGGGASLGVEGGVFKPIIVDREYVEKHNPELGGYYVVYEDGYKSFSPAEAFESGYTLIK